MGRLFTEWLDGRVYSCRACHNHLAAVDELVSKARQRMRGRGRAGGARRAACSAACLAVQALRTWGGLFSRGEHLRSLI